MCKFSENLTADSCELVVADSSTPLSQRATNVSAAHAKSPGVVQRSYMTPKSMVFTFYRGGYYSPLFLLSLGLCKDCGEQTLGKRKEKLVLKRDRDIHIERDLRNHPF